MGCQVRKPIAALLTVLVLVALFVVCLVSALQLLAPRAMPFGVTGPSPVVDAVQQEYSLDLITYGSEAELTAAAKNGEIYGGYVPGSTSDTLITVPAKSFFGEVYVRGGFATAAKSAGRTHSTKVIAALPTSDRTGALVGLLLLPTLIGGYLIASMIFPYSATASGSRRIFVVLGFSVVVAAITALSGRFIAQVPSDVTWKLLPCFALVTAAVALASIGIQAVIGKAGTLVVVVAFIVVGGASAGGGGSALLPTYWQYIGALLPPRYATDLYRNVRYFGGHSIVVPILVLGLYALVGAALVLLMDRRRPGGQPPAGQGPAEQAGTATADSAAGRARLVPKNLIAPVTLALILSALFAVNYMSSGHEPIAQNMPFGVVGSADLARSAQNDLFSLDVIEYSDQQAAMAAMDRGEIYGALYATSSSAEVVVVSTISDISPLDIAANFEEAAKTAGETVTVKPYAPTPLAPKDPFALVLATLLVPLFVGGYMATALLTNAFGSAAGRWRGFWLLGYSVAAGLVVDVIATFWLDGIPSASFWVAWPIMSLISATVALFAAVLRRLLGPVGILLTVIIFLQFGNPSSGGSNGSVYLTNFWDSLGPLLPPRNAYEVLRDTIYFDGHGISQALAILIAYAVVAGGVLAYLDWRPPPEPTVPGLDAPTAADAAAVAVPVGPLP